MKKEERIAVVRIFTDLIKADSVIDINEMEYYETIKSIHNIEFKNLEDKTPLTARKHSLFKDYFDKIWGELDELKN